MKQAKVLIARENGAYHIKVEAEPHLNAALPCATSPTVLMNRTVKGIFIDLSACAGMDSTFMGILAMIGLKAKKLGSLVSIVNASDNNKNLLNGLGLSEIFTYTTTSEIESHQRWMDAGTSIDKTEKAELFLIATKLSWKWTSRIFPNSQNVVDFVKKDLQKEENKDTHHNT